MTDPRKASNLVELIRLRAGAQGEKPAFRYLSGSVGSAVISYAELDRRARSIAAALSDHGVDGEPVLLLTGPGIEFVTAFAGCLYAGAVAVPAPRFEAARARRTLPRLESIVRDARPVCLVGSSGIDSALGELRGSVSGLAAVPRLMIDHLPASDADLWIPPAVSPDSVAYLQYTSGSTADPKGVMVTHRCLLSNAAYLNGISETYTPHTVTVSWMPHYHDYGLVEAIVEPLFNGTPSVLLSPTSFLRNPLRWLRAISCHRGSHSGGPTFAYEHCLRRIGPDQLSGLDLSCWIAAHVGAEPIREEVLDRFVERFGKVGFRRSAFHPSYGLAEATLLVSSKARSGPHRSLRLRREALRRGSVELAGNGEGVVRTVSCGRVVAPMDVAIVNPESLRRCQPDSVGEIWIRGPSIAAGYWRRPRETEATFGARLQGSDEGPFLRTGDLGFLRDGDLYVVGRLKELIIVAGVNHHPPDIEWTVQRAHSSLRGGGCAAFALDSDSGDGEGLVVAVEVDRRTDDLERVADRIRTAIMEEHEIQPAAVVLVRTGSLPRTSSGKLRRGAVRHEYSTGALRVLNRAEIGASSGSIPIVDGTPGPAEGAARIEAWLLERLSQRLEVRIDTLDPESEFLRLGLVSRDAVELVGELEKRLGRRLSPAVLWNHPTVRALSSHLADATPESATGSSPKEVAQGSAEPIAIVGMACRLPGADSPEALWDLLLSNGDAVTEIPADRWDVDALYDPDPAAPGKMTTRWGGFLDGLDRFDATFFGISPREALQLDPRQRLMMELAWEGLEDAGIPPRELAGTRTGVFAATQSGDYGTIVSRDFPDLVDAYSGPGNASSVVANRISHALDLRGPSLSVDTACSGSLVAVHLAVQALRSGEIQLALAGGVNVLLEPSLNVFFSKAGALARDGRCKSFDSRADGIVRSEGAGVLVLKRLGDALGDRDRIRALVLGSAVNQDGRSNGIMAPNGDAQECVLREAYRTAGISPATVQYVEAHGTGTPLGDSIEAQALGSVLADGRAEGRRCVLGSLKTNIGHTEAAAGVAGIIKTVLSLENRRLPGTVHFREPSPLIPFDQLPLDVTSESGGWPDESQPLIAGVSGFGIGGTNAHVVLTAGPPSREVEKTIAQEECHPSASASWLLPLSAESPQALRELAMALAESLGGSEPPTLPDLCHTLSLRRSHHPHRVAVVAASAADARSVLARRFAAEGGSEKATGRVRRPGRIGFVFSGQGSHWPGMGVELLGTDEVFAAVFERCAESLREWTGLSIVDELSASPERSRLHRTDVAQPAIFAVQVALAEMLRSWGVHPRAVVGQSLGEAAAAHVAGVLSLEEALRVVVVRSRLMQQTVGSGRTAVIRLPYDRARLALAAAGGRVSVAGSNSPEDSVVSGDPDALEEILAALEREGVRGRMIPGVEIAFHGPQMAPLRDEMVARVGGVRPEGGELPLYTALEGGRTAGASLDASYWGRNLAEPFRFGTAVEAMLEDGCDTFVEIAPHPVLSASVRKVLRALEAPGEVVPTLHQGRGGRADALAALAVLYGSGHDPNWSTLTAGAGRFVGFPRYPWQRRRHWIGYGSSGERRAGRATAEDRISGGHPLLGFHLVMVPGDRHIWQKDLAADSLHFLDQTRIAGRTVVGEAVLLEMVRSAVLEAFGPGARDLRSVSFGQPLVLPASEPRSVQTVIRPAAPGRASVQISSRPTRAGRSDWTVHVTAELAGEGEGQYHAHPEAVESVTAIRSRCSRSRPGAELYRALQDRGRQYGPVFRVVDGLWEGDDELLVRLSLPPEVQSEAGRYGLHPALVDAGFQLLFDQCSDSRSVSTGQATPFATEIARVSRNGGSVASSLWCHLSQAGGPKAKSRVARIRWLDEEDTVLLDLEHVTVSSSVDRLDMLSDGLDGWFHELAWEPCPRNTGPTGASLRGDPPDRWLVFAGLDGCGRRVRELLEECGRRCVLVEPGDAFRVEDGGGSAQIDPREASHYERLLNEVWAEDLDSEVGVVHLWSLDEPEADSPSDALEAALDLGARSVFLAARALAKRSASDARLWVVTRAAQAVEASASGASEPSVAHAVLWGLSRGLGQQEHPELWGGIVDLDPADRGEDAARVLGEILDSTDEDQVAFRRGRRLAARLRPSSESPLASGRTLWPSAAYLVTGGSGTWVCRSPDTSCDGELDD